MKTSYPTFRRPIGPLRGAQSGPLLATLLLGFMLMGGSAPGQLYEISMRQKVSNSTLIVEGKVIDRFSFWNDAHTLIYTSNLVKISKIFAGTMSGAEIEIMTMGGQIGDRAHSHSHLLDLAAGEIGLFFCEEAAVRTSGRTFDGNRRMQAYASSQGFIVYDMRGRSASDPFHSYADIESVLYPEVTSLTGAPFKILMSLDDLAASAIYGKSSPRTTATPTISSFSPSTVNGGTRDVIVITGTNFGSTRGTGYVSFKNADDGGATYITPSSWEYVSWSDTEIRVHVPTRAGTGTIQVTNSDPATATSASTLTVNYAILTNTFSGVVRRLRLIDNNGNGGYTFQPHTEFNNHNPARTAFLRAFKNWRCATSVSGGVNFDLGSSTAADSVANDGINVIRFDNGSELAAGVLGVCSRYSTSSTCAGPDTNSRVSELDLTFDDAAAWYYGTGSPGGGQSDFESVALHELGHAHQLAHVINTGAVMHYSITTGTTRRVLTANDISAGNNVLTLSTGSTACGIAKMNAVTANAGPDVIICPAGSTQLSAQGGITYVWTPSTGLSSDTIPNPIASPAVTTTYTVSITNGTCLSTSDAVVVTVAPGAPAVSAGSDKSICVGDTASIGVVDGLSVTGTIGTGSSTHNHRIFNTAVEDHKAQVLYTKSELNTAGISGKRYISKVAFNFTSVAGTKPMSSFELAMGNTSATDFTTSLQPVTLVCSRASYTPTVGWDTLSLDTPFLWDGLSNLVVQACFDNSGAPSASGYTTTFTTAGAGTIAWVSVPGACTNTSSWSYSTARPNIRLIASPNMYSWSPSAGLRFPGDANPKASPGGTTTYTVTLSDSNGCTSTDPMLLSVYPTNPTTLTWTGAVSTSWTTVGNWDAPCAVPTSGDTVVIPSSTTPPSGIPAMPLGSFTIDNASGTSLTGDLNIAGMLTLTNGKVSLGSNNLSIGSAGSISGGGSSSFIVTDGTGELRQANIGSGGRTGSILFPVGSGVSSYTPVSIANTGTADEFRVRISPSVLTGGTSGSPITSDVVTRTWHISEATAGGSTASLTLQWNTAEEGTSFSRASCAIARHDGSAWSALQSFAAASGSDPYTRTVSGVSSFSPFGVGDAGSPLPVELVSFRAIRRDTDVLLHWRTQSELNNLAFNIQRTADPLLGWSEIGRVTGHGTTDKPQDYQFVDRGAFDSYHRYYRLEQVDRDGTARFSDVVEVAWEKSIVVELQPNHPNPFSRSTDITFTSAGQSYVLLRVFDSRGRLVATLQDGEIAPGVHTRTWEAGRLPGGAYFAVLQTGSVRLTRLMTLMK